MGNPSGVIMGVTACMLVLQAQPLKETPLYHSPFLWRHSFCQKFTWKFATQYSNSVVSWEARAMISLGYKFTEYLSGSVDLAYYGVHTNKGFKRVKMGLCLKTSPPFILTGALYTALIASF